MSIPHGYWTSYIPGLTPDQAVLLTEYKLFEENPFSKATVEAGNKLISTIRETKRDQWISTIEDVDLARDRHKAWRFLKHLSNDQTQATKHHTSVPTK